MTALDGGTAGQAGPVLLPGEITAKGEAIQALLRDFPFPRSAPAPWSAGTGQHTRRWVHDMGLVRSAASAAHFERIDTGRLTGWVFPDALADRRDTIADVFAWLFIFDDQCDETSAGRDPALLSGTIHAIEAALDTACPGAMGQLAAALADICARLRPAAPATWWQRFSWHTREYLHACLREAANRALGQVPDPAQYPRARREGGAIMPTLDLIEFAAGRYLNDQDYWLPGYQQAREAAADIICWTDDLATVAKEHARGDVHNLVIVLAEHHDLSWAQATSQARDLLGRRIGDYLTAEHDILGAEPSQALDANLRGLRNWMRGHLDWGIETARYQDVARDPAYIEDLTQP